MLDIRTIREDPQGVKAAIATLQAEAPIDEILELDERRRQILQELEDLRHERNVTSKKIGAMKDQAEREPLIEQMGGVNQRIKDLEEDLRQVDQGLEQAMYLVPNLPHDERAGGSR